MDLKSKIEQLKNNQPTPGSSDREYAFNDGFNYALRNVLNIINDHRLYSSIRNNDEIDDVTTKFDLRIKQYQNAAMDFQIITNDPEIDRQISYVLRDRKEFIRRYLSPDETSNKLFLIERIINANEWLNNCLGL